MGRTFDTVWTLVRSAAWNWSRHRSAKSGAALAYYSVFSIGPVIVIATAIAGLFFGQEAIQGEISFALSDTLGPAGSKAVEAMLAGAKQSGEGLLASILGTATLLFAAMGVVLQLKDALNTVWDVQDKPTRGIWGFARSYIISLAGVLSVGFLLLVSLCVTTGLAAAGKYWGPSFSESAQAAGSLISLAVITALFAMMFKWLPDVAIGWEDVWLGALLTALLFEGGKSLIAFYIGRQALDSTFGAAASIIVVLLWVYYTSQILLMGAEFTRAYAEQYGSRRGAAPISEQTISSRA